MLKNLKKSEIVVYVVALMLVTAGYFNYTANDLNDLQETYSEDVQELEDTANTGVGDAVLVSNNQTNNIEDLSDESKNVDNNENDTMTTSSNVDEENYYASTKLEREKMYASLISTYQNILNNSNISETQKSIASKEITNINNTKNSIMICENLLKTKGFDDSVILINENNVNVVVNIKNGLTPDKVAQIQNVVSREIGTDVENIHIMEK